MYKPGQELLYCGNRTFRTGKGSHKRYYELRDCKYCGTDFLADKYGSIEYCSDKCKKAVEGVTLGRPIGIEHTESTKNLIANSKTGQHHSKETRQAISKQVEIGMTNTILPLGGTGRPAFSLTGKDHPAYKYGSKNNPLYMKWAGIKQRCYDPEYRAHKYYYDKGVKICEEWLEDFPAFKNWCENNGWKPGLHLHRKNPLRNYEPDNCVFLTPSEHSKIHHKLRKQEKEK